MTGGDLISMARRRAGLTQQELGERVGCRQATIARWERGDREPSWGDVGAVARLAGCSWMLIWLSEDRSWWGEIAMALTLSPAERVRRVLRPEDENVTPCPGPGQRHPRPRTPGRERGAGDRDRRRRWGAAWLATGDLWRAGRGLCGGRGCGEPDGRSGSANASRTGQTPEHLASAGGAGSRPRTRKVTEEPHVLPGGGSVLATETLPGTAGFADLARNAEPMVVGGRTLLVASLLDLLRIADALIPGPKPQPPGSRRRPLTSRPSASSKSAWSQAHQRRDALALRAVLDVRAAKQAAWDGEYVSAAPGPDFGPED